MALKKIYSLAILPWDDTRENVADMGVVWA